MAFDLSRVIVHTTARLNAGTRSVAGVPTYTNAIGDNARAQAEIAETCLQAAIKLATAICESDSHPYRVPFIESMALVHGDPVPFHYGDTSVPTIVPYSVATVTLKGVRKAFDRIESLRINKNGAYGPVHNVVYQQNASPLAGFYDIVNGIFYFTGFSAAMDLADFDRTDVAAKLPEAEEPAVVDLAAGMSAKDGDTSDGLFAGWMASGMNRLNEIRGRAAAFSPIDDQLQIRGDKVS